MCGRLSSEHEALFCIGLPGPQPLRKGIAHRSPRWGPPTPFTAGQSSAPCEAGWVLVGRRESIDARFSQCALEGICRTHDECRAMAESHPCQGRQVNTVKILPRLSRPFFRWRPTERSKVAIALKTGRRVRIDSSRPRLRDALQRTESPASMAVPCELPGCATVPGGRSLSVGAWPPCAPTISGAGKRRRDQLLAFEKVQDFGQRLLRGTPVGVDD